MEEIISLGNGRGRYAYLRAIVLTKDSPAALRHPLLEGEALCGIACYRANEVRLIGQIRLIKPIEQ